MKRFSTLLTAAAVFFAVQTKAQNFSENFDNASALTTLSNNCWINSGMSVAPATSTITNGSIMSGTSNFTYLATPALTITTPLTVSFQIKIDKVLSQNATRTISVCTIDNYGNVTGTYLSNTYNKTSLKTNDLFTLTANVTATGTQRIALQFTPDNGDGNTHIIVDNLSITGPAAAATLPYYYGTTPCNSAPTAVDDYFVGFGANAVSGSVIGNDTDPNSAAYPESVTGAVLVTAPTAPGTFVLNSNGTFTFTPDPATFTGGIVSFTYKAVDNGWNPLQSATYATVYIDYPERVLTPMPIKLISFAGNITNNKAQLKWSVAENETGNQFQVLRSADGKNFTEAGVVFINTKVGTESYSFADPKELDAVTYYKLKIINKDGSVAHSNVIALKSAAAKATNDITILKNPVASTLTFTYSSSTTTQGQLAIYNSVGVKVYSSRINTQKGNNAVSLNLDSHMAAGAYILEVVNGSERAVTRLVKK